MATQVSLCASNLLTLRNKSTCGYIGLRPVIQLRSSPLSLMHTRSQNLGQQSSVVLHRLVVLAITEGSTKSSKSDEKIPSWARPDSDEPPPWARDEGNGSTSPQTIEIPFYVYLLASAVTAIAAIGSVFEYINQKPVFGVLSSDSVFYAPLLGFFAFTGIPTSAFLWFKSVQAANKASEEQDRRDGYR
ncbi:Dimethylaniline monooxygenase [N-oxide-forming] 1 [Cocos nucifera]|uniref:Dimethylaniline monooxygenase [N-oxide-forming] 1 n=1 Tax=Cocos nucifera TaxID=13894 RepID=A0A8K0NA14_COCNU|nr:Dimethylaniline monooxygenase [N-oxide-forming] 1 [Cocos nucifera]